MKPSEYKLGSFTRDDLEKLIKQLEDTPRSEYSMQMAASDYPFFSDEEFKALCNTPNIHFLGGMEGVTKMRARMDKLGIKY